MTPDSIFVFASMVAVFVMGFVMGSGDHRSARHNGWKAGWDEARRAASYGEFKTTDPVFALAIARVDQDLTASLGDTRPNQELEDIAALATVRWQVSEGRPDYGAFVLLACDAYRLGRMRAYGECEIGRAIPSEEA